MALESKENRICDAVLLLMRGISSRRFPDRWLTSPQTVERGVIFASLNLPRPVVLVSAHSATDTPMVGPVHDGLMEIGVHLIVDAKDADRELLRLVADVGRAVQSDERLGGLATFSRWTHYRLRDDIMEKGDGSTAVATLALEVLYTTNHDGS